MKTESAVREVEAIATSVHQSVDAVGIEAPVDEALGPMRRVDEA